MDFARDLTMYAERATHADVIPVQAGIQGPLAARPALWIPAFAGMTAEMG